MNFLAAHDRENNRAYGDNPEHTVVSTKYAPARQFRRGSSGFRLVPSASLHCASTRKTLSIPLLPGLPPRAKFQIVEQADHVTRTKKSLISVPNRSWFVPERYCY